MLGNKSCRFRCKFRILDLFLTNKNASPEAIYWCATGFAFVCNCNFAFVFAGLPVDNTMLYLLDIDFRPVKAGDVGELFVSGSNLAAAYVAGRDAEKFVENPLHIEPTYSRLFRTGDFARIEKGVLVYEGRTDSQVPNTVSSFGLLQCEVLVEDTGSQSRLGRSRKGSQHG